MFILSIPVYLALSLYIYVHCVRTRACVCLILSTELRDITPILDKTAGSGTLIRGTGTCILDRMNDPRVNNPVSFDEYYVSY